MTTLEIIVSSSELVQVPLEITAHYETVSSEVSKNRLKRASLPCDDTDKWGHDGVCSVCVGWEQMVHVATDDDGVRERIPDTCQVRLCRGSI